MIITGFLPGKLLSKKSWGAGVARTWTHSGHIWPWSSPTHIRWGKWKMQLLADRFIWKHPVRGGWGATQQVASSSFLAQMSKTLHYTSRTGICLSNEDDELRDAFSWLLKACLLNQSVALQLSVLLLKRHSHWHHWNTSYWWTNTLGDNPTAAQASAQEQRPA